MKQVLIFSFLLAILWNPVTSHAQLISQTQRNQATQVLDIAYIKSKTLRSEYLKLESELWRPLHESRVASGEMTAWFLFEVTYPYGSNRDYDFVAINIFPGTESLKNQSLDGMRALFKKLNPNVDTEAIYEKTMASRELVKGEVFTFISGTTPIKLSEPSDFMQVNFMRVPDVAATYYENLEKQYALPLHSLRVKAGDMQNWSLLKRTLPLGVDYPYQYITMDEYANWEMLTKEPTPGLWEQAHDNLVEQEIWNKFIEVRDLVRQETWKLVSYVVKQDAVVRTRGR